MNQYYRKFIGGLGFFIAFTYIVNFILKMDFLLSLLTILIYIFLIAVIPLVEMRVLILMLLMLTAIIFMLFEPNYDFELLKEGVRYNLPLFSIILITPLLGILISAGDYLEALKERMAKLWNNVHFFYWSMILSTHGMGVILNVGSISINHQLMSISKIKDTKILTAILNRGFVSTMYWSPYFAAMALVLTNLNIGWSSIGLKAILFTIIILLLNYLLEFKALNKICKVELANLNLDENGSKSLFKVIELVLLLCSLIIVTFFMNYFIGNMVVSICIVSIVFPVLWCVIKGKFQFYRNSFKVHVLEVIPNMKQELSLYLLAGLFGAVFIQSEAKDILVNFLVRYLGDKPIILLLFIVSFITVFALISIPPIVTVTLLVSSVDPTIFGLSVQGFALALLFTWGSVTSIAPTTSVSSLLSSKFNSSIIDVSIKWNYKFYLVAIFMMIVFILTLE